MARRTLVTGASGLLGGRLAELLPGRVVAAVHRAPPAADGDTVELDLESETSVTTVIARAGAEAVLHCAALADADACQRDPLRARRLNAVATGLLARAARRAGARLVFVSTDLVCGGGKVPAREDDPARPGLAYARSKREGEEAVLDAGGVVVRVPLIVGRGHGPRLTASEAIAHALFGRRPLRLFTDQYRTPADPDSLAAPIATLVDGTQEGVFHLGGPERLSRHQLGLRVARVFGLDPASITPVRQADHPDGGAPRPADVSLDSSRARRELGYAPRPLDVAIAAGRMRG